MKFVQRFSNKQIPSLKYESDRSAKYSSTTAVASSFVSKSFPAQISLGLGVYGSQKDQI